jgi:hypothetical protein
LRATIGNPVTTAHKGLDFHLNLPPIPPLPGQVCQVFDAADIYVSIGANMDDGLTGLDHACLGDIYELSPEAVVQKLVVERGVDTQVVAAQSTVGSPGAAVSLAARYTMMAADGDKVEMLALQTGDDAVHWILPLSPMGTHIEYTLVKMELPQPGEQLLDLLCISFARGTMITLGDGSQRAIEGLVAGDRVLTRDHGPQALRWIGQVTLRALGAYAPVVIPAGAMGNAGDLVVSQHHRMFLYQRRRDSTIPSAELLVQAKHLVDGSLIFLREGGVVDYFSLVFDAHEIIYAEGIPAESLMVSEATVSRLPPELAAEVQQRFPGLSQNQHFGTEADKQVLASLGLAALKRGGGRGGGR